ncbi:MAG: hypothetical protein KAS39_02795, partial [Actinomycetia bacterium]|nr:hypothetical protein [Actinomycetes bacterium]
NVIVYYDTFRLLEVKGHSDFIVKYISGEFINYLNSMGIYPKKKGIMDDDYSKRDRSVKKEMPEEDIDDHLKNILQNLQGKGLETKDIIDKMGDALSEAKDDGVYIREPFGLNVNPNRVYLNHLFLKRAGRVYFRNAAPIKVDEKKLYKEGYNYEAIITSPQKSFLISLPEKSGKISLQDNVILNNGNNVELMSVVLMPKKPWNGKMFLFSSSSIVANGNREVGGNWNLLRNLLMSYTKPDKLTSIKFTRYKKSRIPDLNTSTRLLYRFFTVGFVPLIIIIIALAMNVFNIKLPEFSIRQAIVPSKKITVKAGTLITQYLKKSKVYIIFLTVFLMSNSAKNYLDVT